jgi:hypothetical protein
MVIRSRINQKVVVSKHKTETTPMVANLIKSKLRLVNWKMSIQIPLNNLRKSITKSKSKLLLRTMTKR